MEEVDNYRTPPFGALGIFAKEPVPGGVKTRLCPPLTPTEAAEFYRVCLEETVARLAVGPWTTVLFYAGRPDYFAAAFPGLPRQPQRGADLGARMANALTALLARHPRAVLIGSDSPDLPLDHLHQAYAALADHQVVLAPAADGGYILIGERRHHPELFRAIPWSTAEVLPLTRQRAHQAAISLTELAPWEDLDDLASLRRLCGRSPDSLAVRHIRRHLDPLLATAQAAGSRQDVSLGR